MKRWYALFTKPRGERPVSRALTGLGLEVFAPFIYFTDRRGRPTERPFFPRYVLARFDWEGAGMANVQWMPGMVNIVRFEGQPAYLGDDDVEHLIARMDALDGDAFMALKPGEPVRIIEGPLTGMDAVFQRRLSGDGRVAVLLKLLGRQTRATLPGTAVERSMRN